MLLVMLLLSILYFLQIQNFEMSYCLHDNFSWVQLIHSAVCHVHACVNQTRSWQMVTWFTSSLECLDHAKLHTCDPVSTHCSGRPVIVFQNLIRRSAVPPPLANRPCWWGDHAIALTAARCSAYVCTGPTLRVFQTNSLLSFPPDAKCWWSGDHFKPHT